MLPCLRPLALSCFLAFPTTGCCSLFAVLCGPDRSQWISESYATPEEALRTFMEAVRRDQPRVVWEALSQGYRERLGIPGSFEAALVWEKLKEQTPGIHLLGSAEITAPVEVAPDRFRYTLDVAGHPLAIYVVRCFYIGVSWRGEDREIATLAAAPPATQEAFKRSLSPFIRLARGEESSSVELSIPDEAHGGIDLPEEVDPGDILGVTGSFRWKVDDVRAVEPVQG
jgi:hypothetical protein